MVTGLHCGTHGRPFSQNEVRYFWEEAEEAGIPVGLANIEHNNLGERTFFVGHPEILSDPQYISVEPDSTQESTMRDQDGNELASLSCSVGKRIEIHIEGKTSSEIIIDPDFTSDHVALAGSDERHTAFTTRFRYDSESNRLYVSPLRATYGFAEPRRIERRILDEVGLPPVKGFPLYHKGKANLERSLEEELYHATWFGKVAYEMMHDEEDGLWFHRHNTTDGVGHMYLGLVDPAAHSYDPHGVEGNWQALRRWYITVDRLLEESVGKDPQARLAMCTDHGHVAYKRTLSLGRLFLNNGLVKTKDNDPGKIDEENSRIKISNDEIFINPSTCERGSGEYERLRSEIIETLRGLVDPETGRHIVTLAVRKENAQALQFWGKKRGDVLFELEPGYFAIRDLVADEIFPGIGAKNSSVHHGWLPGYETDVGSSYSFILFSGLGKGERDIEVVGAPHLVDFAPTVLSFLGLEGEWLQGRVLTDMIDPD